MKSVASTAPAVTRHTETISRTGGQRRWTRAARIEVNGTYKKSRVAATGTGPSWYDQNRKSTTPLPTSPPRSIRSQKPRSSRGQGTRPTQQANPKARVAMAYSPTETRAKFSPAR